MDENVFRAILAMDAYNRSYNEGIASLSDAIGTGIGDAEIIRTSLSEDTRAASFYAIAYEWDGKTVISYRGTDQTSLDTTHGYKTGAGVMLDEQARMAIKFYKDVAFNATGDIQLTGHSLGGGLAGLVGALHNRQTTIFDNMPFQHTAESIYKLAISPESSRSDPLIQDLYNDVRALVYSGVTPWSPSFDQIHTYAIPHYGIGEQVNWLSALRGIVGQPIGSTALRFPADVPLGWTLGNYNFEKAPCRNENGARADAGDAALDAAESAVYEWADRYGIGDWPGSLSDGQVKELVLRLRSILIPGSPAS